MNFLAHSYLSGDNDGILLGNFIADAVKGNKYNDYKDDVKLGILLHRFIDHYTDNHECFLESKHRLSGTYGKFSGIIIDIFYDHFLSKYWKEYSDKNLKKFTAHIYLLLTKNFSLIPARVRRMLPFLVYDNWLVGYADPASLRKVFHGMDRRTGNQSGMKNAVESLFDDYEAYENDFRSFFPDIRKKVDDVLVNGIKKGQQDHAALMKIDSLLNG